MRRVVVRLDASVATGMQDIADQQGCTLTALFQAMGELMYHTWYDAGMIFPAAPNRDPRIDETYLRMRQVVKRAREIDMLRRQRRL